MSRATVARDIAAVELERCMCVKCTLCNGGVIDNCDPFGPHECDNCHLGIIAVCNRCELLADLEAQL